MTLNDFRTALFDKAAQEGFTEYEIYYVDGESFEVAIYESEIDKYSVNTTIGLSFRGLYHDRMGYAYTEVLDEDAVELLIKNAKANATAIENEDREIIYGGKDTYGTVKAYNESLTQIDAQEKIDLALKLEKDTLAQSQKVTSVQHCIIESFESGCRIMNSKGLDLFFKSNGIYGIVAPIVEENGKKNTAFAFKGANRFQEIDTWALAKEVVDEALAYTGAETIGSGKYRIALRNDVAADLLATFSGIFSSDNAQKGLSLLKGKTGTRIASSLVTIIDDPLMENGLASAPFDAEGVAAYTKNVVENGTLMTLLYNLRTALKDGVKSTGNGSKASYASPVDVSPSNFYIQPGEKSFDAMLQSLGDGLLITDLQGMHSGASMVSGDFSLAAKGFLVEKGQVQRPIEQITIAGNFYKLLESIEEIGSDLKFGLPSGHGCFGSPTIIVKELSIAGK